MEKMFYDIVFHVDRTAMTVTPTAPQRAGIYGDDKVAKVTFRFAETHARMALHKFRIEINDGGGGYDVSELLSISGNEVVYSVPSAWTAAGTASLRLVEIAFDENGEESAVLHYPPVYLYFADREDGEAAGEMLPRWQAVMTRLETSVDTAAASAADAAQAAREAQASASAAQHIAATVQKGDKGDQGDKGDKGDTPVRGVDYWTAADKAETNEYIDEQIGGIEQAVNNVLAVQEALIGGEVSTQIDFVVEEGTPVVVAANSSGETTKITGNFKYRKWNSGALDIFGSFTSPTITFTTNTSGFCSGSTTYPVLYFRDADGSNLFNAQPLCAVVGNSADTGAVVGATCLGGPTGVYDYGVIVSYGSLVSRTGNSNYYGIPIHVRGTWK